LKYYWLIFNTVIWTIVFGLSGIFASFFEKDKGKILGVCARNWGKSILFFSGIKWSVSGLKNIKSSKKPYFFVSNHASALDIPLAFAGIPNWLVSIAKIELKSVLILGWVMSTGGHIFVDRRNKDKAYKSLENAKKSLNASPRSVLLFPEGTRTKNGDLLKIKTGGINMAIELGIPIIPVACKGTFEMLKNNANSVGDGFLELRIGEQIITKKDKNINKHEIAMLIKEKIENLLNR
jgi:1-acyl-sn-glycerol-3-phosphate acyltransferase